MPFTLPKAFYSPKYSPDNKADMTDIRSTICWKPDIVTDKDGHATVTFYTADNPGSYTLILEGADMSGNLGATRTTLNVRIHEGIVKSLGPVLYSDSFHSS